MMGCPRRLSCGCTGAGNTLGFPRRYLMRSITADETAFQASRRSAEYEAPSISAKVSETASAWRLGQMRGEEMTRGKG